MFRFLALEYFHVYFLSRLQNVMHGDVIQATTTALVLIYMQLQKS